MKKQIFSFGDSLEIFDENEVLLYFGEVNMNSKLVNVLLKDREEKVIASLMEVVPAKFPTFEIMVKNEIFATIYKETSWQKKSFLAKTEHEQRIRIIQPFQNNHIQITFDDEVVGTVRRDRYSWRESYGVELQNKKNMLAYLTMLLLIVFFYDEEPLVEESL